MIIRNYLVNDMYEAMVKIKQDLGNNAVIVSKRNVRQKGLFGFFRKRLVEVTAATETTENGNKGISKKTEKREETSPSPEKSTDNIHNEVQELRNLVMEFVGKAKTEVSITKKTDAKNDITDMLIEMDFNKKVIDDFSEFCKGKNVADEDVNRIILY